MIKQKDEKLSSMESILKERHNIDNENKLVKENKRLKEDLIALRKKENQLKIKLKNLEKKSVNGAMGGKEELDNKVKNFLVDLDIKKNNMKSELDIKEGRTKSKTLIRTTRLSKTMLNNRERK